jgi:transcriptional regulator with XRE-family HTH domain
VPASNSSDFIVRVARRISARRRELALSQEALAALLGIAVKNVQRLESGRQNLSLRTLERVASALETSPEALLAGRAEAEQAADSRPLERLERAGFAVRPATTRGRRPASAVPVTTLRAAAGALGGAARLIEVLGWAVVRAHGAPPEGQFVAEVQGSSMSPLIPPNALCLFGPPGPGLADGRVLLVAHEELVDDDLGGPYALKRVRAPGGARAGARVVLESVNPDYAPIEVEGADLRIIAELVRVLVR